MQYVHSPPRTNDPYGVLDPTMLGFVAKAMELDDALPWELGLVFRECEHEELAFIAMEGEMVYHWRFIDEE